MRRKSTFKLVCLLNIIFLLNVSLTSLILFFSVIVMAARPVLVISANISGIELKLLNTAHGPDKSYDHHQLTETLEFVLKMGLCLLHCPHICEVSVHEVKPEHKTELEIKPKLLNST